MNRTLKDCWEHHEQTKSVGTAEQTIRRQSEDLCSDRFFLKRKARGPPSAHLLQSAFAANALIANPIKAVYGSTYIFYEQSTGDSRTGQLRGLPRNSASNAPDLWVQKCGMDEWVSE